MKRCDAATPGVADQNLIQDKNKRDQPDWAGRGGMVSNLLLLVLCDEWCGECTGWFNQRKQVLGDYRTEV
jgi:hypothetical protein